MKKNLIALIIGAILAFQTFSAFAVAENIIIDNEVVVIPEGMGSIKEQDGRTFVPVRFVSEYLGCKVNYTSTEINGVQQESATVISQTGTTILLTNNSNLLFTLSLNGPSSSLTMDTNVFIDPNEDRMYIPIRFLAEALDYVVGWDEATQTVTMTKNVSETEAPAENPENTTETEKTAE